MPLLPDAATDAELLAVALDLDLDELRRSYEAGLRGQSSILYECGEAEEKCYRRGDQQARIRAINREAG